MTYLGKIKPVAVRIGHFLRFHRYHVAAIVLLSWWCLPYFTTGNKVNLGDFTFFAQAYEAMRVSILNYHQFPWFNPWVSGGVPLYANPQMGVFSIQMVLVLLFGTVQGLKIAIAFYTFLGYGAMYLLLRKYFKLEKYLSTCLSLIWLFCTFFVAHLPEHFTFVWYMLAPYFIYLALTMKDWKRGLLFGGSFAIMALSQIHNPFMHISLICAVIILVRLCIERGNRRAILVCLCAAVGIFVVLAGHRAILTYENVYDFPRVVLDNPPRFTAAILGPLLPLSLSHPYHFLNYPQAPALQYGYVEATTTIGASALIAAFVGILYIVFQFYKDAGLHIKSLKKFVPALILLSLAALCFVLAFGAFAPWAPYNLLKHLPVFSQMRVSTRWFLFFDLGLLVFIGLVVMQAGKKSFLRFVVYTLITIGVLEMFTMNVGYQANLFSYNPVIAPKPITSYPFEQTSYFGQTRQLPGGGTIPNDGNMPALYREYEATTYNLGILYANDSLVQLALDPRHNPGHPTCPWEEGCHFVRSNNAVVTMWSPNEIKLKRTGPGPILLNMNNSNYFVINGNRNTRIKVAEPFTDFVVANSDATKDIDIRVEPSILTVFKKVVRKAESLVHSSKK